MRTYRDLAEAALDYTDVTGESDILSNASTRQLKALCSTITGALQELYAARPESFRVRAGANLVAPTSQSITLTTGSSAVVLTAFGRDLRACSVKVGETYSQVLPAATSPGAALLTPWTGATGAQSIKAYCDAIAVGNSVLGDVHLEGYGPLKPVSDRASYTAARDEYRIADYGARQPTVSRPRWSGQPEVWWVESAAVAGVAPQLYLRVAPVPEREFRISYDMTYTPAAVVSADLINDTAVLPVPEDFVDVILLPYVLQRWTASPWFRASDAKVEIARQYKEAHRLLEDWSPQVEQGSQIIVQVY